MIFGRRIMSIQTKSYHRRVAALGCVACMLEGWDSTSPVSVHHVEGRVGKNANYKILPLCGHHHQGTREGWDSGIISVHPYKSRFEERYGNQKHLLMLVDELLAGLNHHGEILEFYHNKYTKIRSI